MKAKYFLLLILCAMLCIAPAMAAVTQTNTTSGSYTIIIFNGTGTATWSVPNTVTSIEYLVVGGGGGGGRYYSGGGGAGGFITGTNTTMTGTINITVGAGGYGYNTSGTTPMPGQNGTNSSFGSYVAIGGGGGNGGNSAVATNGRDGGSGGGGGGVSTSSLGGTGTPGQGNNGGRSTTGTGGGGGGGSGEVGSNGSTNTGGKGGNGTVSNITGSNITYSGGGGGSSATPGAGGSGGGGKGATDATGPDAGTNDLGGGGGGGSAATPTNFYGGNGGSGVVIVRYLSVSPTSNFASNITVGSPPLNVQFNDTSSDIPTSWNWSFGDGAYNTTQNPVHTYSSGGLYTVSLNATNIIGSNTTTKTNYIKVLSVNFTGTPTSGGTPLTVAFNDTTTPYGNATNWNWSFGDGQQSTLQNVTHVYTNAGSYNVTLNVTADFANGTKTQTNYITVNNVAPTANFYAVPAWGSSPLNVSFYDISTGSPTSWAWQWGDGEANGTTQNPYHEYASNGQYTVNMTATNSIGATTKQRVGYILVGTTGGGGGVLNAIFRSNVTSGVYPLSVQFTDLSTGGPETYNWSWGDATSNATTQNPIHTYNSAGSYTVTLTVTNATQIPNSSTSQEANFIVVANTGSPVSNFYADTTWGINYVNASFYDITTGGAATSWNWSFGDGTYNTTQNPVKNYTTIGTYTVSLNATNAEGSTIKSRTDYIQVSDGKPETSFYGLPTNGVHPFIVQFTDTSGNTPTSWNWSFGDGTYNTTQNPSHTYSSVGIFNVSLTAFNAYGNNTYNINNYITSTETPPVASFYGIPTTGTIPFNVTFTDTSSNTPTSWAWQFGDGTSNATTQNPVHQYTVAGTYTVNLTATNTYGSNTTSINNMIQANSPAGNITVAAFSANTTSGIAPLSVQFTDESTENPIAWLWIFGDSTTNSTLQNPLHVYSTAGNFTVSLRATNVEGSDWENKTAYINVTLIDPPVANFTSNNTFGNPGTIFGFTDLSTNSPISWQWSFGDGVNSTVKNATHSYSSVGNYTVTLTATNIGGSNTTQKINYITVAAAPIAAFHANATTGYVPKNISFTDDSTNNPTAWYWDFGDSNTSTLQNPTHVYWSENYYTVRLNASNINGSDWENKTNYLWLTNPPTPLPTQTPVHSGGYAPPYQAPDVPFPQNNNTGIHLTNVSVDTTNKTVTFTGNVTNATNDTTAWFTVGSSPGLYSYYTVALVPDANGTVTGSLGLSSPMVGSTKYYVGMSSTKGTALETLNFTTPSAGVLPTSTYSIYWNQIQSSNKTPLTIIGLIPLPLVDLLGGNEHDVDGYGGRTLGWTLFYLAIIGILIIVIAVRQDSIIMVFMLVALTGVVWMARINAQFIWIVYAVCALAAGTILYRLWRNRRS